jgi:hypothetical protein
VLSSAPSNILPYFIVDIHRGYKNPVEIKKVILVRNVVEYLELKLWLISP